MTHAEQVIKLLKKQIPSSQEVADVETTAERVIANCVKPLSGGAEETNGLIYGLIQSGKTGVLTVTGALGADEGYRCILILTSDIEPLYKQTLGRVQEAFPGIDIIGMGDFKDAAAFIQRIKANTCAIVTTKNTSRLGALIENFKKGNLKGLSCLIIDDEADQASLNTKESKDDGTRSAINEKIATLRDFFEKNSYVQVTATPQALFLQTPGHDFRPTFTVLSEPGSQYVGGKDFFSHRSPLVKEFDINDISMLAPGSQPNPSGGLPISLLRALDTFMIGAIFKRSNDPDANCAFLCHVSTRTSDHNHIVSLLRDYKNDLTSGVKARKTSVLKRLRVAYDDLASTHSGIRNSSFDELVEAIGFLSPGITVKLVNGQTDEDVAVRSPYNLFVGGNKLGRGVTIKNLLVSYYGRNPKKPQADTVLQHARMYGYRRNDIGLLRLFLPRELHVVFRAITKMEEGLRDLIQRRPSEAFRGIYLEGNVSGTRRNVLAPGAVGVYAAGSNYNPAQVLRDSSVAKPTSELDALVSSFANKSSKEVEITVMQRMIELTRPDPSASEHIWDPVAVSESLEQFARLHKHKTGFVYVDRDRGLRESRDETRGILTGGEVSSVPGDRIALFLLRTKVEPGRPNAAWWPQIRFPDGVYAFAFSI